MTGVSPGAAFGTAKRWLPERFAEAVAQIGEPAALFGSKDERDLCENIAADLRSRGIRVHNFAGETTLAEYIDLAAACRVYSRTTRAACISLRRWMSRRLQFSARRITLAPVLRARSRAWCAKQSSAALVCCENARSTIAV